MKVSTIAGSVLLACIVLSISVVAIADVIKSARKNDNGNRILADIDQTIDKRRHDEAVRLVRYYRQVNEKELAWFHTWHESDEVIYDANGFVVYYNDTQTEADYVWIYEIN